MLKYFLISICLTLLFLNASAYNIFIDKKGTSSPEFVLQHADSLFQFTDRPGLKNGDNIIWIKIPIENKESWSQYKYVLFTVPFIYKADFYYQKNNALVHDQYGYGYKTNRKLVVADVDEFRIQLLPGEKKEVYVRLETKYITVYSYQIMQMGEMIKYKDERFYSTLLFVIITAIFGVFSLFLHSIYQNKRFILAYFALLVVSIMANTAMTGYYRVLASIVNPVQSSEATMLLALLSSFYLLRSFFETFIYHPIADKIIKGSMILLLSFFLLALVNFNNQTEFIIRTLGFMPGMLIFSGLTFYFIKAKEKYAIPIAFFFFLSTAAGIALNLAYLGYYHLGNTVRYYQIANGLNYVTLLWVAFLKGRDMQVIEMTKNKITKLITDKGQELAKLGSWNLELPSMKLWVSDELYRIFEIEKIKGEPDINQFLGKIHEDDQPSVKEVFIHLRNNDFHETSMQFRLSLANNVVKYISVFWVISGNNQVKQCTGYMQDVTEKTLNDKERSIISQELLDRNGLLQEFSYSVSHNLRSPFSNILGLCNMLEKNKNDLEKIQTYLPLLTNASQRMDSILRDLNDLLNYDKQINIIKSEFKLEDIALEAHDLHLLKLHHLGATFTWDFSTVGSILQVKPYFSNIFQNMLSNSLKYSKPDTKPVIHFSGTIQNNNLVLEFKDNGIGIDLIKNRAKLFGIYQRFNPKAAEGNGLGLYLIKLQVEKMKGNIDVCSEPGEGTTFMITVPL